MSERELQKAVIALARTLGFRVAHFPPLRHGDRWMTPRQGDAVGFPDLVIVGHGRLIVVELKSDKGSVETEQRVWLEELELAGVKTYLWRPKDWAAGHVELALAQLAGRPSTGSAADRNEEDSASHAGRRLVQSDSS